MKDGNEAPYDKGLALFEEIYGPEMAKSVDTFAKSGEGFGSLQAKWTLELPFGQIWTRTDELPRKLRSFAVLGICIGLRQTDEIKYHTKMGIANGLTKQELEEIFYSCLVYGGFPIANTAKAAMLEAMAELEAEGHEIP